MPTTNLTAFGRQLNKTIWRSSLLAIMGRWIATTINFILRQVTFSFLSWHFLGTFSSLLHFTKYLPFIHHPNSCIVVWKEVICLLVLLASLSLPITGCPCFTKSGIFVDSHTKRRTSQPRHYVQCLCWQWRPKAQTDLSLCCQG